MWMLPILLLSAFVAAGPVLAESQNEAVAGTDETVQSLAKDLAGLQISITGFAQTQTQTPPEPDANGMSTMALPGVNEMSTMAKAFAPPPRSREELEEHFQKLIRSAIDFREKISRNPHYQVSGFTLGLRPDVVTVDIAFEFVN